MYYKFKFGKPAGEAIFVTDVKEGVAEFIHDGRNGKISEKHLAKNFELVTAPKKDPLALGLEEG